MRRSLRIGGSSSVQWRKVWRSWRLRMCFRRLLCVRIEIDQLQCMNCWVIIHCLSVSCTTINHSGCALVIWSSLQLTSKQWIITQQFTAGADLFLKYIFISGVTCVWLYLFQGSRVSVCIYFRGHVCLYVFISGVTCVCMYLFQGSRVSVCIYFMGHVCLYVFISGVTCVCMYLFQGSRVFDCEHSDQLRHDLQEFLLPPRFICEVWWWERLENSLFSMCTVHEPGTVVPTKSDSDVILCLQIYVYTPLIDRSLVY